MTVGTIAKRRRSAAPAQAPPASSSRGWIWAVAQLLVLGAEIFIALFVLAQPLFRPTNLVVTGTRHLAASDVKAALGLRADRTIFFVNHADLERQLEALPWVQSAAVSLALPNRVSVRVTEWTPSAVLQVGEATYYVNALGKALDPTGEAGPLLIVNRPDFGPVKSGQPVIENELLPMLLQLRAGFQPAFKISIMSFTIDARDTLSAQTDRGWTIIFGRMLTSDDRATLEPKVAALHALSTRVDLTSRQISYINLEDPGAPAVQMRGHR